MTPQELQKRIIEFMGSIYHCLNTTSYANDRVVYQQDMVEAASWLIDLQHGKPTNEIASVINSSQTDKKFGDYFRQGEWAKIEWDALTKLRSDLESN